MHSLSFSGADYLTLIWVCYTQELVCHEITDELQTH